MPSFVLLNQNTTIPLKLDHQTIQIKVLVCDSECPYDLILGQTSLAQL